MTILPSGARASPLPTSVWSTSVRVTPSVPNPESGTPVGVSRASSRSAPVPGPGAVPPTTTFRAASTATPFAWLPGPATRTRPPVPNEASRLPSAVYWVAIAWFVVKQATSVPQLTLTRVPATTILPSGRSTTSRPNPRSVVAPGIRSSTSTPDPNGPGGAANPGSG